MIDPSKIHDYRISAQPELEKVDPPPVLIPEMSCNDCQFAFFADYGYSNYTVEGTDFFCTIGRHPKDGFDRFYGEDNRLDFAKECKCFVRGAPITMDVDHEDETELTESQKMLLQVSELIHSDDKAQAS